MLIFTFALGKGFVNVEAAQLTSERLQYDTVVIMFTWLVCVVFSFRSFFTTGYWKLFFLCTPIIVPAIFTIATILSY